MENKDKHIKGVGGDKEWHDDKNEFFTLSDTENLGVTDMFVGDGFDIIHQHAGEVHLSDLSPEEEETAIPKGSKKVKKIVLKPRLDKEPFNINLTQEENINEITIDDIPEGNSFRDIPEINDDKLNIPKEKFLEYLNNYHREKLIKELTPTLECIIYNCYDGWKDDPDNEWGDLEHTDEIAQTYCNECGEELNKQLEQVDMQIIKLGLVSEPHEAYLQRPFPYTYNEWIEDIAKEINPDLFVNQDEEIDSITQHEVPHRIDEHIETGINPDLEVNDIIRVLEIDREHARMPQIWGKYKVQDVKQDNATQEFYYDIVPYPDPELPDMDYMEFQKDTQVRSDQYWYRHGKTLYRGDKWIYADVDRKTINEHKQPGLNPELEVGETIRIVDIDREREDGKTMYNSPPPELRPERWTPYDVVEKVTAGHKSEWDFKYTLVPEGEIMISGRNPQGEYNTNTKLLYPWLYQWIYADTPSATKVDRLTISEHNESLRQTKNLNPDLMIGDEIMVVSTEGIHDFGAPQLYKPYVVVGIKHGTTMNREIHKWTHDEDEEQTPDRWDSPEVPRSRLGFRKEFDTIPYTYYQIEPIGMTDEDRTGAMLAGGGRMKPMYIFPSPNEYRGSDQWILRPGFLRGELNEDEGYINDMVYIDEPRVKHIKRMGKDLGSFDNFPIDNFMNIPPPENESDTTEDEIEHIEEIPVDNKFVDTTDDIHKHFKRFLKSKNLEYPEDEIEEILSSIGTIILKLKYHYNRPRPQQVAAAKELKLNPTTLDTASTPSYPSGHATQGRFIGRYLSDIYPDYYDELMRVGDEVGDGRLMAKVHYPSDQAFGKVLGDELYNYYYSTKGLKLKEITLKEEMEELSPPLALGDKIMVWDLEADPVSPGTTEFSQDVDFKMPSTLIGTVIDVYEDEDIDKDNELSPPHRGGIKYIVRDDNSGEEYGLYQGIFGRRYSQSKMVRELSGRDKWKIMGRYEEVVNEQEEPDSAPKQDYGPTGVEHGTFTRKDIVILNYISKHYTPEALKEKWEDTHQWGDEAKKWDDIMKLFSISTDHPENLTVSTKYARWAWENWDAAKEHDMDFGKIPNPIKTTLKWYDVDMDETGSQVEYKSGNAEILGYDEDDVETRAEDDFYGWGGEMETHDWGDYEVYDNEIVRTDFLRVDETKKDEVEEDLENWAYDGEDIGVLDEQMVQDKVDMIKHDIFKVLYSRFEVIKDNKGEISDNEGNKYSIIDTEEEVEDVTLSDLLVPITDFLSLGIEDGTFTSKDVDNAISAVTDWLSLELNKKQPLLN